MFDDLANDTIDVLYPDGTLAAENLKASVQNGKFVYLAANGLLVEPGYLRQRNIEDEGRRQHRSFGRRRAAQGRLQSGNTQPVSSKTHFRYRNRPESLAPGPLTSRISEHSENRGLHLDWR